MGNGAVGFIGGKKSGCFSRICLVTWEWRQRERGEATIGSLLSYLLSALISLRAGDETGALDMEGRRESEV